MNPHHRKVLQQQLLGLEEAERDYAAEVMALDDPFRRGDPRFVSARNSLFEVQKLIADKRLALAQIETAEAQTAAARSEADAAIEREDSAFWLRRFLVSLSIGNGAGFVAIATGALQNENPLQAISLVVGPLHSFAIGIIAAGAVPAMMWLAILAKQLIRAARNFLQSARIPHRSMRIFVSITAWLYQYIMPLAVPTYAIAMAFISTTSFVTGLYMCVALASQTSGQSLSMRDFLWEPGVSAPPHERVAPRATQLSPRNPTNDREQNAKKLGSNEQQTPAP